MSSRTDTRVPYTTLFRCRHAALRTAARRMCFDHFALVYDRRAGDEDEANLLIHDYPDAWANVYVDFDLGGADPVRRAGERSLVGFEWQHLPDLVPMTEGDRHMLAVGRENGVGDGFTEIGRASLGERVCQAV